MYCVIALSSVWFSRRELLAQKGRTLITAGLLPLVGGLFNLVIFAYGLKTQGTTIAVVAAVGVVVCIVLAVVIRGAAKNEAFFTSGGGRTDADGPEADGPEAVGAVSAAGD
jgi:hypothetical protein